MVGFAFVGLNGHSVSFLVSLFLLVRSMRNINGCNSNLELIPIQDDNRINNVWPGSDLGIVTNKDSTRSLSGAESLLRNGDNP